MIPAMTDRELEEQIAWACRDCEAATDPLTQREAWERMRELIAQRSPEQVARMEVERGLRSA